MARTNVRRLRPTEVAAVADVLEAGMDQDLEELAKTVVRTINKFRAAEASWVKMVKHGSGFVAYGPYRSPGEATEDTRSLGPNGDGEFRLWSLVAPYGQPMDEIDREDAAVTAKRREKQDAS